MQPVCIFDPKLGKKLPPDFLWRSLAGRNPDPNLEVMVVAIAGRARKGKSFLLNFMIRYLRSKGSAQWLQSDDHLEGFGWNHDRKPVTQGVLLWPELFKMRRPNGRGEIGILLVDTQGVFDNDSSRLQSVQLFALSMLLASVQLFNLTHKIDADDVQHLGLFADYARNSSSSCGSSDSGNQFQKLVFLVRDWQYAQEFQFGSAGGQQYLQSEITNEDASEEFLESCQNVARIVGSRECFLMPHPGARVNKPASDFGELVAELEPLFVSHVEKLLKELFSPSRLKAKTLGGEPLRLRDFCRYAELTINQVIDNKLNVPNLQSALAETANRTEFERILKRYRAHANKMIDEISMQDKPMDDDLLRWRCDEKIAEFAQELREATRFPSAVDTVSRLQRSFNDQFRSEMDRVLQMNRATNARRKKDKKQQQTVLGTAFLAGAAIAFTVLRFLILRF